MTLRVHYRIGSEGTDWLRPHLASTRDKAEAITLAEGYRTRYPHATIFIIEVMTRTEETTERVWERGPVDEVD